MRLDVSNWWKQAAAAERAVVISNRTAVDFAAMASIESEDNEVLMEFRLGFEGRGASGTEEWRLAELKLSKTVDERHQGLKRESLA